MSALTTEIRRDRWDAVARLYEEALAQPEPDRERFLRERCPDAELRREIVSLIAAGGDPSNGIDRLVQAWPSPSVSDLSAAGRSVGPYRLIREIGQGGMGIVYLAERADGQYERRVALKIATASLFDAAVRERFLVERDILAGLTHPNIATLFDGGVTPEGHPYFTMEYVEGRPIDAHCDARMLDIRARVRLFLDVCAAVSAAHRALIVHRDLKPSNVLVTGDGAVKLLDFGIAKLLAPLNQGAADDTLTGARLLTPAYASPEQIAGRRISTATDVYALGLLLHELLSGRRAHRLQGRSAAAVERVVLEQDPLPPCQAARTPESAGARSLAAIARARSTTSSRLCRSLNGDLARIVAMALRKEPERRYESVSLLADDLERYLDGRPVRARGQSPLYRARKFATRHGLALAAAALGIAGLAGYAALTARHAAEMAAAAAREQLEAAAARETADFLVGLFTASDPDVAQGREISAREILQSGVARVERLSAQPALQARLLNTIGLALFSLGRFDEAQAAAGRAMETSRRALGDDHLDTARDAQLLGRALLAAGKPRESIDMLRQAMAVHQRTTGPSSAEVATDRHELGYALAQSGALAEAEPHIEAALASRRALLGPHHPDVATSLSGLAYVRNQRGRPREAAELYREALNVRIARLGEQHPEVARARQNLAVILTTLGDFHPAEVELRRALGVYREVYGERHPSIATTLNNLGRLEAQRGNRTRAAELMRQSLDMRLTLLGAHHPSTRLSRANLAAVLGQLGRHGEAEALLREVLATWTDAASARATVMTNLADVLLTRGKLAEAETTVRRALALEVEAGDPLGQASCLSVLGRVLAARGRTDEAREALERSLAIRIERLGAAHPHVARTRDYLAAVPQRSAGRARQPAPASGPR